MDAPINLNSARKVRASAAEKRRAEENRAKFGRSKTQKALEGAEAAKLNRHVESHRRRP